MKLIIGVTLDSEPEALAPTMFHYSRTPYRVNIAS